MNRHGWARSAGAAVAITIAALAAAPAARADGAALVSRAGAAAADADVTALAMSGDGRYVAFASTAANLGGGTDGTSQVYRADTATGALTLVSGAAGGGPGDASSTTPSLSADGRYVCFESDADDLVPGVTGHHIYVRDLRDGSLTVVDRPSGSATAAPLGGTDPVMAAGGGFVAFLDYEGSFTGDPGVDQVVVRDLAHHTDAVASRADGAAGALGDGDSGATGFADSSPEIAISTDGRYVAFLSDADDLDASASVDGSTDEVYLRDTRALTTRLVSRAAAPADAGSDDISVSDAGAVAFASDADNLVAGATGGLFVRAPGAAPVLVSRSYGLAGAPADTYAGTGSDQAALSADGRYVVWTSDFAGPLGDRPPGAFTGGRVFRRDLATGDQDVVSRTALGVPFDQDGDTAGVAPAVSADGFAVAFASSTGPAAPDGVVEAYRAGVAPAPAATAAPAVAGTPAVGRALTCLSGEWSGLPTQLSYRWLRDGSAVASGRRYTPATADAGHALACRVTASNGATGTATSAPVTVTAAAPAPTGAFAFVNEFGSVGSGPGELSPAGPSGVAVAPDGNLVVVDRVQPYPGAGTASLFTPGGRFIRALSITGFPDAVAAGDAAIAVASAGAFRRLTQDDYLLGAPGCAGLQFGQEGIAIDHEGRVYVSDVTSGESFVVCAPDGRRLGGPYTIAPSNASHSRAPLAIGPDDHLYTAGDGGIRVFDHTGALLRTIPLDGAYGSDGYGIYGIAVGPDGRIWLGDLFGRVTAYEPDGTKSAVLRDAGEHTGQIGGLDGLAVEPDGTIVVADGDRSRIERFREVAGGGGLSGGGTSSGGGGAPNTQRSTVVNVDHTPPGLTVGGPRRAELRRGAPAAGLRCSERCTVTVTGQVALVRRTVKRVRAQRVRRRRGHARRTRKASAKLLKNPNFVFWRRHRRSRRTPPRHRPRHGERVTSRVIATADVQATTATLAPGATTRVALRLSGRLGKAARKATSALFTLNVTAADPTGNTTTRTLAGRTAL